MWENKIGSRPVSTLYLFACWLKTHAEISFQIKNDKFIKKTISLVSSGNKKLPYHSSSDTEKMVDISFWIHMKLYISRFISIWMIKMIKTILNENYDPICTILEPICTI